MGSAHLITYAIILYDQNSEDKVYLVRLVADLLGFNLQKSEYEVASLIKSVARGYKTQSKLSHTTQCVCMCVFWVLIDIDHRGAYLGSMDMDRC